MFRIHICLVVDFPSDSVWYISLVFPRLRLKMLRPGVFWFLPNLDDPNYDFVGEMIRLPILRHVHGLSISYTIHDTVVFLMFWVPVRLMQFGLPKFLPYHIVNFTDTQVSEFLLQLLLLVVIVLKRNHIRQWVLYGLKTWCLAVSRILGIRSYLFGNAASYSETGARNGHNNEAGMVFNNEQLPQRVAEGDAAAAAAADQAQNVPQAGAHQALQQRENPTGYQPYSRPSYFPIRIFMLFVIMCACLPIASAVFLSLPVWIGRRLTETFYGPGPHHELYTAFAGLHFCWLVLLGVRLLLNLLQPNGWANLRNRVETCTPLVFKCTVAFSLLLGVIPLLFGLLFNLLVVLPLLVNQSPIFSLSQHWFFGLCTEIVCVLLILRLSPDWWLKRSLDRLYQDGILQMNLDFVFWELAVPVIEALGLALAPAHVVAYSVVAQFVAVVVLSLLVFEYCIFRTLEERFRRDFYQISFRILN